MAGRKRILVVEDESAMLEMLKMRLEAADFEVLLAHDGQEGLEKAKRENPDLIVLDVTLPVLDGYEVCNMLKKDQQYFKIPVIMLTARAQAEEVQKGRGAGADAYVTKPFESERLVATIHNFLKKQIL